MINCRSECEHPSESVQGKGPTCGWTGAGWTGIGHPGVSLWARSLHGPPHWGGGEVQDPPIFTWQWKNLTVALEDWAEAEKPCGCRRMPAIPVISRGLAGGKQGEMLAASSPRSQGCCVPQDTPSQNQRAPWLDFAAGVGLSSPEALGSSTVSFPDLLGVKIQGKMR